MEIRQLSVPDAWEFTPDVRKDDRGVFLEWYRFEAIEQAIGHPFSLRQANVSVSKRGVLRGIHFADVPPSQAKYVTVTHGSAIDFIVDVRAGSPTFGTWDAVRLDATDRRSVYLSEGLGHAFLALEDDTTVSYLVSEVYAPGVEHGVNPLDPAVGLTFPEGIEIILSEKDSGAPMLADALASGMLPSWSAAQALYASLATQASRAETVVD